MIYNQPKPDETPEEREARLARIKREIQEGTYDTEERFESALQKLLNQIDDTSPEFGEDASSQ